MEWLSQGGIFLGIIIVLWACDRLLLWMEAKGWIYWRKVKRKPSADLGMVELFGMADPNIRHVIEAQRQGQEKRSENEDRKGGAAGDLVPPDETPQLPDDRTRN